MLNVYVSHGINISYLLASFILAIALIVNQMAILLICNEVLLSAFLVYLAVMWWVIFHHMKHLPLVEQIVSEDMKKAL